MRPSALLLLILLLAGSARGGPLSAGADAAATDVVGRARSAVVRVEGLGPGGRRLPSAGVVLGSGRIVLTWSRLAAKGWEAVIVRTGGERSRGTVLARDAETGVTVVKMEAPLPGGLSVAAGDLAVASPVLSAGHPFGTERADDGPAVSLGVVAQVRRPGPGGRAERYLLSATMNPGDWGGPLLDGAGRVAGILIADTDTPSGLALALPIARVPASLGDDPEVARALVPDGEPAASGGWPVHEALRAAAEAAAPGVASLIVSPEEAGKEPWRVSAVLADGEGHLVTSVANLAGAGKVVAVFPDGREFAATALGRDERLGLVALRIEGEELPRPVRWRPEPPRVGSFVAAVGNPSGRSVADGVLVTVGIVGGSNRSDRRYCALHTDAGVNASNAGGALVDLEGRVVGILTTFGGAALTDYGANSGIGFAIPAAAVLERLPGLVAGETKAWRPGYLGVQLDLTYTGPGIRISSVVAGEAAEKAGLKSGDVVLSANDQRIETYEDLRRIFGEFETDEKVRLEVDRGGERREIVATLGVWPR